MKEKLVSKVNGVAPLSLLAMGLIVFVSLVMFTSCALTFPYDWDSDYEYQQYKIVLKVDPDDAQVILNGKWIGDAYEFSTSDTAIKLSSRNSEIVIKREGFIEEVVNLHDYSSHNITVRLKLQPDTDTEYRGTVKDKPAAKPLPTKVKPVDTEKKTGYTPKPEPEKKTPMPAEDITEAVSVKTVEVGLEIQPLESSIYFNGKFWGISPESGKIQNLRLKPGKYTLEVVKPGYKTFKKELEVKDQTVSLCIKLEEVK